MFSANFTYENYSQRSENETKHRSNFIVPELKDGIVGYVEKRAYFASMSHGDMKFESLLFTKCIINVSFVQLWNVAH